MSYYIVLMITEVLRPIDFHIGLHNYNQLSLIICHHRTSNNSNSVVIIRTYVFVRIWFVMNTAIV